MRIKNLKLQKSIWRLDLSSTVKNGAGFTLIELIVVIAILGILAGIGLTSFRTSQMKSRDAKRKSDLEQVQRAVEMYMNDYANYPTSSNDGEIMVNGSALTWGTDEFKDQKETLYIKQLPGDPRGNPEYCYVYDAGPPIVYKIYARLENTEDPKATLDVTCPVGGVPGYNYGVSSSNTSP